MAHTKCLINFYRSFDLNGLARIDCYTNYNQVVRIISASKNNQYFDFQFIQQDAVNYLINDKSKLNFIELQLVNLNYIFEKAFEDHKFKIAHINTQYDKNNVKIINSSFSLFNYKDEGKSKFDIVDIIVKPVINRDLIVEQDVHFEDKPPSSKSIILDDEVIFRRKLKKIIKKVDFVLGERQKIEKLKQSKRVDEIARKLDEFIQNKQLDEKPAEIERVLEYKVIDSKVKNIIDSKPVGHLVPYQGMKQYKLNWGSEFKNSILIELPKSVSHIQKTTESAALVLYKYDNQIRSSEAKIKLVNEALPYEEIDVCPNNYHELIGKKLKDFMRKNLPNGDEEIKDDKKLKENDKNIMSFRSIDDGLNINFHLNRDDGSGEDGGGIPPQPPGGPAILAMPYSGKAEYDPVKKHISTIFIANLGLNVVRQPFFQKLINALYVNIFFMDNDHEMLSTVSFDSIYEYYLAYQGNGIGRLIYNISGIDTFLNNSAEVENKEESIVNEDGMREIGGIDSTNQQTAGGNNVTNGFFTNISNYNIEFPEDSDQENKEKIEGDTSYYSSIALTYDYIYNKVRDWIKGGEENVGSELEVPLLDKSGENNEIKYSNGNNSSDWIVQGIFSRFTPKSDKEKKGNNTVKEEEEVLKTESLGNTTPIDKIKLNLIKASKDDGNSEVSTAPTTPRNNIKMRENATNAPKKQPPDNKYEISTNTSTPREHNTLPFPKFGELDQKKIKATKTFIISFNDNGECEIEIGDRKYTEKKTLNLEYGGYVVYSKMPKNNNGSNFQYLHDPCNAPEKRKDDSNTNFERGENNKELDLGEMIISLEKLFENSDIDDI